MFCNHPSWLYAPPGMQQKWIGWMGWCWCCDIFGEWGICICAQFLSTFEVHTMQTNSFLKKRLCQKSNMCGHIMPTNNLKQVFLPKSIGKNRTCEKTIIVCFIWSDGVHTVCV